MSRVLQPCGSFAAYKRHLRHKEIPCEPCKQASRDQKMVRLDGDRETRKVSSLVALPPIADIDVLDDVSPLDDARENLLIVKAALDDAVPREVAVLSKRRQELVTLIAQLGGVKEVSLADQLVELRSRRAGA